MNAPVVQARRTAPVRPATLPEQLRRGIELLRINWRGAFIAAPTVDYTACWMRDQLYTALAYYYTGEHEKFVQGVHVIFDRLEEERPRIEGAIRCKPHDAADFIHAKFHAVTLQDLTRAWGHHQVDAVGLFLFIVGFAHEKGIPIATSEEDFRILKLMPRYLESVRYWDEGDFGMWEEGELEDASRRGQPALRTSSVGAAVAGLEAIQKATLAEVPQYLINAGKSTLALLLPGETRLRDTDMAQLSLIWPYRIVSEQMAEEILNRVRSKLAQTWGLNRYWGDNYGGRSSSGVSAEWPLGFFWLSIIASDRGDEVSARNWFERGMKSQTPEGYLPEFMINGKPNERTPLAWTHAFALIALELLEKKSR